MCLATVGEIVSVDGDNAIVDFGGVKYEINVSLVKPKIGDDVLVHAGFAISLLDEEEAKETLKLWDEMLSVDFDA